MSTPTETAIQRCTQAWLKALAAQKVTDILKFDAIDQRYAGRAYRNAMPYLLPDPDAIELFLACVTHGMVIGAILPKDGTKLLYAAQVLTGSLRARQQTAKKTDPQTVTASPVSQTPPPPPPHQPRPQPAPGPDSSAPAPQNPRDPSPPTPPPPSPSNAPPTAVLRLSA